MQEIETPTDHIFMLRASEGKSVLYESVRQKIVVNGDPINPSCEFTNEENRMMLLLFRNPYVPIPYRDIMRSLRPDDRIEVYTKYELANMIRVCAYRIRNKIKLADECLEHAIKPTKGGLNLVYTPHESVADFVNKYTITDSITWSELFRNNHPTLTKG